MRELEYHNAIIQSTMLGFEDHGIMSFFLYLEWDGGGVSGGISTPVIINAKQCQKCGKIKEVE